MPRLSHSSQFRHPNYNGWAVQIIKLVIRPRVETSINRGSVDSRWRRFQTGSVGKECSFCRYRVVQKVWNFSRKRRTIQNFLFCWPCIASKILANNQLDALFPVFIYLFHLSTCFEYQVLIIRRSNYINTSSGMVSLFKWLLGMAVRKELQFPPDRHTRQSLTQTNHTRWCINTIRSPDDEHLMLETCREMK